MKTKSKISKRVYIEDILSEEELDEVARIWAVEREWWGEWREKRRYGKEGEHWAVRGEDAWYREEEEVFGVKEEKVIRLIDMRGKEWVRPSNGEVEEIGWVEVERIVPWRSGVVPKEINKWIRRNYGVELFGYQLYIYYQVQGSAMIIGGRGSAKTSGIAIAAGAWVSLHPGQPWAHFAYTETQAMEVYDALVEYGSVNYGSGIWVERYVKGMVTSPHGKITINGWKVGDKGTTLIIRPLGVSRKATTTRTIDVRRTSIDECTYDIEDERILEVAEATSRGTNRVVVNWLGEGEREEVLRAKRVLDRLDRKERDGILDEGERIRMWEIEDKLWEKGVTCNLTSIRVGNRGPFAWIDEYIERAAREPGEYYAEVVSFLINPHLDRAGRQKLLSVYNDIETAKVELYGQKPVGRGSWFTTDQVLRSASERMTAEVIGAIEKEKKGWVLQKYGPYVVKYERPWRKWGDTGEEVFYVMGSDPGTGVVPKRDSWVIEVWEVDLGVRKARMVAFSWGNLPGGVKGSWKPYLQEVEYYVEKYGVEVRNNIIQVGGQERGIMESAWGEGVIATSVNMGGGGKGQMANYARQLIGYGFIEWPDIISSMSAQLTDWEFRDSNRSQDLVMAFFGSSWALFNYFYEFIPRKVNKKTGREKKAGRFINRMRTRHKKRRFRK